jgi:transcriptional regulator with XRE-family HTH domain
MNIGISIRKIRKEKELTQKEFAKIIGITQTYLSQIETGDKTPTIGVLEAMSTKVKTPLPIIFWMGIEEKDIEKNKRDQFNFLKPTVDEMIKTFF